MKPINRRGIDLKRWKVVLLLSLVLSWSACAFTPSTEEKRVLAQQKYDEAISLQSSKLYDEMLTKLREAVELAPDEPLYIMTLANVLFSMEHLEEAEANYKKVLMVNPKMTEAYRQLGRLYMHKRDWVNAEVYLKEALQRPGLARPHELYNWLALTFYAQSRFNDAEKKWKAALEISDNYEIRMNLAKAYQENELFVLAQESLEKALELNPKSALAHYDIAQLFLKDRQFSKARQHFSEVIRLEPLSEMSKASRKYLELMPPEPKHGG